MGCTKLPRSGCRTLTRGCVGSNHAYNIVSFRLANNHSTTIHFVSDLGLTAVTARITTSVAVILRPTDRARHRVGSRRLIRTKISPKVVHLSVNVRGISSVVGSLRRTLGGTWVAGWDKRSRSTFGGRKCVYSYVVYPSFGSVVRLFPTI